MTSLSKFLDLCQTLGRDVSENPESPGMVEQLSEPKSRLARLLNLIPRALASKPHIIFLLGLLVYLVFLPLSGVYKPSATAMLIGGNWTNVTGDIGACIAAGGTLVLLKHSRRRNRLAEATHKIMADLHLAQTGKEHPAAIRDGQEQGLLISCGHET